MIMSQTVYRASIEAPSGHERWKAVLTRDASADGQFVYGVRSTRIYCRPSCPARRPRLDRVVFFDDVEDAEAAGFRACRRCSPRTASFSVHQAALVASACRRIESSADRRVSLAALAAEGGYTPRALHRIFTRVIGLTPRQYAAASRLDRFKARLRDGEAITGAMYDAGFSSTSRVYERADASLGMTPGAYRRGGVGARIVFSTVDSPVGGVLVASTERGVCAVRLGTDEAELVEGLRAEYPAAELAGEDRAHREWVSEIVRHLAGELPDLDLPVDVRATAFQRRVWRALQRIPYGETLSYGAVARAVGRPTAARAVAQACATNPVALVVPCHRVVREGGGLGGYRWGIERKRALLERERTRRAEPATA